MWKPCIIHATSSSGQGICSIYQSPASFWCLVERIKWHLIKWLHGDWPLSPTNLTQVLIRFRRWKFALTADILQKAFLYIAVHKDDWWFLWDCDGQVKVMRFRRVPFGNCSSPFLLNATVQHHLSLFPASGTVTELQHNLCSVRLADLIRTRNAMVFLFSLAEFSLSCGKQMPFWNHLKICLSSDVNRQFIYLIHYDLTPRWVISLMRCLRLNWQGFWLWSGCNFGLLNLLNFELRVNFLTVALIAIQVPFTNFWCCDLLQILS